MKQDNDAFFQLSAQEMRSLGYQVIDEIVDHFANINERRVHSIQSYNQLEPILGGPIPKEGTDPSLFLAKFGKTIFENQIKTDHPRFFSFIPGPSNYIGTLAETLTTAHNVFAGHWLAGSAATMIEMTTIKWLCELCGFREGSGGIFTSGGSAANLMAIATGRKISLGGDDQRGTIYYSKETHNSLAKGLRILGMGKKEMRPIETNDDLTINLLELERQIEIDIEEGLTPFCLVANAGTTNTGAIDPMNELADLAFKHQMWLHADGAYGAAAVISEREKSKLSGLHRVDSLTLDPHKWWFQPFEIGCLLVRNGQHLSEMFGTTAPYLKDTESKNNKEINYYDRGLQLTRSFKAFKLYFSLKTFGLSTFQKAIEKGIDMAEYIQGILEKNQNWKVITPAQLGIITFRYEPQNCRAEELDQLALQMSQRLTEEGFAMVLTTRLFGKTVLRMCPIHPNVTKDDIRKTIEKLESYAIP